MHSAGREVHEERCFGTHGLEVIDKLDGVIYQILCEVITFFRRFLGAIQDGCHRSVLDKTDRLHRVRIRRSDRTRAVMAILREIHPAEFCVLGLRCHLPRAKGGEAFFTQHL